MKKHRTLAAALSLVGIVCGLSSQAIAGAGQPPGTLAACELPQQSGTPISGIGSVVVSPADANGLALVVVNITLSHSGLFNFTATLPNVEVVNGSLLDAVCNILVAPGTVNNVSNTTLNDQIVTALGFKNRNVMITSDSIQGTCADPTSPTSKCQTLNNPAGLTFTGDLATTGLTGTGTFTLYIQP